MRRNTRNEITAILAGILIAMACIALICSCRTQKESTDELSTEQKFNELSQLTDVSRYIQNRTRLTVSADSSSMHTHIRIRLYDTSKEGCPLLQDTEIDTQKTELSESETTEHGTGEASDSTVIRKEAELNGSLYHRNEKETIAGSDRVVSMQLIAGAATAVILIVLILLWYLRRSIPP